MHLCLCFFPGTPWAPPSGEDAGLSEFYSCHHTLKMAIALVMEGNLFQISFESPVHTAELSPTLRLPLTLAWLPLSASCHSKPLGSPHSQYEDHAGAKCKTTYLDGNGTVQFISTTHPHSTLFLFLSFLCPTPVVAALSWLPFLVLKMAKPALLSRLN